MDNSNTGDYVYVVYWINFTGWGDYVIDMETLGLFNESEILGVYTNEKDALMVEKSHDRRIGSYENDSYSGEWTSMTIIEKIELNKINLWTGEVHKLIDEDE